jgi:hypothetical protein
MDNAMKAGVTNDDVLSLIDNNSDAALKNGSKFTEPTLKEPDKPGGQPKCKPGKTNSRGSLREDEAAVKLTQSRYNTIQLPEVDGGNGKGIKKGTNPDLLIEGEVFDCYSPETSSVGNIYKVVQDKSTTQASRVVLNLEVQTVLSQQRPHRKSLSTLDDQRARCRIFICVGGERSTAKTLSPNRKHMQTLPK